METKKEIRCKLCNKYLPVSSVEGMNCLMCTLLGPPSIRNKIGGK